MEKYNVIVKKDGKWSMVNDKALTESEANKMKKDYIKSGIKHEAIEVYPILMPDVNPAGEQYGKGAKIPNNYDGKSPEQVWNAWTEDQREHFLADHNDDWFSYNEKNSENTEIWFNLYNKKFSDLPKEAIQILGHHVGGGQYGKGGKMYGNGNYLKRKPITDPNRVREWGGDWIKDEQILALEDALMESDIEPHQYFRIKNFRNQDQESEFLWERVKTLRGEIRPGMEPHSLSESQINDILWAMIQANRDKKYGKGAEIETDELQEAAEFLMGKTVFSYSLGQLEPTEHKIKGVHITPKQYNNRELFFSFYGNEWPANFNDYDKLNQKQLGNFIAGEEVELKDSQGEPYIVSLGDIAGKGKKIDELKIGDDVVPLTGEYSGELCRVFGVYPEFNQVDVMPVSTLDPRMASYKNMRHYKIYEVKKVDKVGKGTKVPIQVKGGLNEKQILVDLADGNDARLVKISESWFDQDRNNNLKIKDGDWDVTLSFNESEFQDFMAGEKISATNKHGQKYKIMLLQKQFGKGTKIQNMENKNYYYLKIGNIIQEYYAGTISYNYEIKSFKKNIDGNPVAMVKEHTTTKNKPTPQFEILLRDIKSYMDIGNYKIKDTVYETDRDKMLLDMEIADIKNSFAIAEEKATVRKKEEEVAQAKHEADVLLQKATETKKAAKDTIEAMEAMIGDSFYDKKLKTFLDKFPNDAKSWGQATDEIREIAKEVREAYNEQVLDVVEGDPRYVEALDFKSFGKPSQWNTNAKEQIFKLWSKLPEHIKGYIIEGRSEWFNQAGKGKKVGDMNHSEFTEHQEKDTRNGKWGKINLGDLVEIVDPETGQKATKGRFRILNFTKDRVIIEDHYGMRVPIEMDKIKPAKIAGKGKKMGYNPNLFYKKGEEVKVLNGYYKGKNGIVHDVNHDANHIEVEMGDGMIRFLELSDVQKIAGNGAKIENKHTLKKIEKVGKFWHARLQNPKGVKKCRVPAWGKDLAETVNPGAKITTCQDKEGNWYAQNIMIPAQDLNKSEAKEIALKIASKISK